MHILLRLHTLLAFQESSVGPDAESEPARRPGVKQTYPGLGAGMAAGANVEPELPTHS